jgi:hypothetical protein
MLDEKITVTMLQTERPSTTFFQALRPRIRYRKLGANGTQSSVLGSAAGQEKGRQRWQGQG